MAEHIIGIPKKCKYTQALFCPIDPPVKFASISMTFPGEKKPFGEGKVFDKRFPEIAAFLFRPNLIDKETKERAKPLKKGDKIKVKIVLYKKGDSSKRILSEPFQTEEAEVEVT